METNSILGTLILFFTGLVSYKGFIDAKYQAAYLFHVDKILIGKEYKRLITSGFLHGSWLHFGFNMIALLSFSVWIENVLGWQLFLLLYFASLLGGNLLALYFHRNHGDYTALGASGAVSGIVMAAIILDPLGEIGFILIPIGIKSWIIGILFVLISIFGIKSQSDNIGHEAHLGGALTGAFLIAVLEPKAVFENWWVFLIIVLPVIGFLILINRNPAILLTNKWFTNLPSSKPASRKTKKKKITKGIKTKDNRQSDLEDTELNQLLDKIKKEGIDSLSSAEKDRLERFRENL